MLKTNHESNARLSLETNLRWLLWRLGLLGRALKSGPKNKNNSRLTKIMSMHKRIDEVVSKITYRDLLAMNCDADVNSIQRNNVDTIQFKPRRLKIEHVPVK